MFGRKLDKREQQKEMFGRKLDKREQQNWSNKGESDKSLLYISG